MKKDVSARLLKNASTLMLGFLMLFGLYDLLLLLIAFLAPNYWSVSNTLTTVVPGFELPTVHLSYRLVFIGRQVATLGLAALLILPIAGIVHSLDNEGAFSSSNIVRLRLVALGCGIYGLGPVLIPLIPLDARIPLGLLNAFVNWPAAAMVLVALVLAEIFKDGLSLRQDAEATI